MPAKPNKTTRPAGARSARTTPAPPAGRRFPVWAIVAVVIFVAGAIAIAVSAGGGDDEVAVDSAEVQAEYGRPTVAGESLPPFEGQEGDGAVGMDAPAVSGQDFAGEPVAIEPGEGAMALLFVAHWCPHCRDEVPVVTRWLEGDNLPDDV